MAGAADLDTDRIAAAAMRVLDEGGAERFTMRAVADELGVTPMALYHHVADKAGLVALLVDAAIREQELPPPTGDWREDLWEVARWMRDAVRLHPALGQLRRAYRVWTPSILPMTERWLSVWQQSGLDVERATLAAATSSRAISGAVDEQYFSDRMDRPDAASLALFPNARLLLNARLDPDSTFEFLVRALIDGLHARLMADAAATARRRTPRPNAPKRNRTTSSRT